ITLGSRGLPKPPPGKPPPGKPPKPFFHWPCEAAAVITSNIAAESKEKASLVRMEYPIRSAKRVWDLIQSNPKGVNESRSIALKNDGNGLRSPPLGNNSVIHKNVVCAAGSDFLRVLVTWSIF